jgi:ABC-type transport system involved in cytochrome bd biosynthesis fused ATPase/permease subunit
MVTTYIYIVVQCVSILVASLTIAFYFEWRTALVTIGGLPFILLAGLMRAKFKNKQIEATNKAYKDSAQIVT